MRKRLVGWLCLLVVAGMLGGCGATLEDFQSMSSEQRADYLCNNHRQVAALDNAINDINYQTEELEVVLARGYRIHSACKEMPKEIVEIDTATKTVCYKDGGKVSCKKVKNLEKFDIEYRTVCEDIPVAIDGDLERDKLKEYRWLAERNKREADDIFDQCYRKAKRMGVDESYQYYQSVR